MSDPKTPAEMLDALGKPFPRTAIKQRQGGGGKSLSYVETHTVIHRLNTATNGDWTFHVRDVQWRNDLLMVLGELTIPGLGTRSGFGVQKVSDRGGEDLVKGASSDALKKCATLFGVALDLYGPDYEAEPTQTPQRAPQRATRPAETPQSAPTAPTAPADRDALMKRLHAKAPHDLLHAVALVWRFDSLTAMSDDKLAELDALLDGKGPKDRQEKFNAWRYQWEHDHPPAEAAQSGLHIELPAEDEARMRAARHTQL